MRTLTLGTSAALLLAAALAGAASAQTVQVDSAIAGYQKTSGVSGNLSSIGSDTLNNLMTLWAEGFKRQYPNINIQIEGKGSTTAPPALIAGTSQIGPMSREMKSEEIDAFEKKFGYKPTAIRVAVDALAVFINKDNPLDKLSFSQVDAIFSKARKCGGAKEIVSWGQVGVTGELATRPISLYGRNSASGTYGYFKEHPMCKGDFKDTVKEQPGSAAVVQGVTEDKAGIGYSGMGYKTSGVKALKISLKDGGDYVGVDDPTQVYSGAYPIARFLRVYVNKAPNKPLDPMVAEFVKYVLSNEGQQVVVKDGFLPLKAAMVQEEHAKLQ
ncbi:MAG: PstS family phosphate ABC transporter substrate-binding protein [Acidobacteriota bacterium]